MASKIPTDSRPPIEGDFARPPHDPLEAGDQLDHITFTAAQFVCYLDVSSLKLTKFGQLQVGLIVPADQVDAAFALHHFPTFLPISVDVQLARRRDIEEEEG